MNYNQALEMCLKTWFPKDHRLHLELDLPTIRLASTASRVLDIYGNYKYKPGFDWWRCKTCKDLDHIHYGHNYIPLVLDELGDWWYYWRILAYLSDVNDYPSREVINDAEYLLSDLNYASALIRKAYLDVSKVIIGELFNSFCYFKGILYILDTTLEEVTRLNYQKLNSEETSHGWRGA